MCPAWLSSAIRTSRSFEWLGWFAPTATPAAKVNALNAAVNAPFASSAMGEMFDKNALQPLDGAPTALASLTERDYDYWQQVVKATGFTPED